MNTRPVKGMSNMTTHPENTLSQQGCNTCGHQFHVSQVVLEVVQSDMRITWVAGELGDEYQARVMAHQLGSDVERVILFRALPDIADLIEECEAVRAAGYVRVEGHMSFDRTESGHGLRPQVSFCEHDMQVICWSPVQEAEVQNLLN